MIKITDGKNILEVTNGAFKDIYSRQGFTKYVEVNESIHVEEEKSEPSFEEELVEKPISQWTKTEVKKFAKVKGIDISETKNVDEAKELIKQYI